MSRLNYNHFHYFWVVAREGRLTHAAEKLRVSQSALSAQIRQLEHALGHALFERRGRGLVLTEAGRIALDYADAIFSAGEEMLVRFDPQGGPTRQTVRVGVLSTLSRNFQINFLRPVLSAPDVDVLIRSGSITTLLDNLAAHKLDVVLVNQVPLRDSATSWTAHLVDEQEVALVGVPARLAGRVDHHELLSSEPLILPSADCGFRNAFDVLVQRLGVTPRVAAEVDDMAMLRLLAREDLGLAVLPPIVVTDELANGGLIKACALPGVTETFFAIISPTRLSNPWVERLIERAAKTHR